MASSLELIAGSIIILSIVAKVITDLHQAKRIRVLRWLPPFPRIVLLIGVGLVMGPGLGLVGLRVIDPSTFGDALPSIVGLAVAIILFEGGFQLNIVEVFNQRHSLKLILIGVPITFFLGGLTIWFVLGIQVELAFLIAALLTATGPTVIEPILDQVEVSNNIERVLTTEGIVNDALSAVLAVVIFEFAVVAHEAGGGEGGSSGVLIPPELATSFVVRIAVGLFIGAIIGWMVYVWLLEADLSAENTRLVVLALAIFTFILAESIVGEAGIVASAVCGAVLGNGEYIPPTRKPIPHKAHVEEFGSDITTLVLGIIFIILAAMMSIEDLRGIVVPGMAIVAVYMLVIRPLSVFASLYKVSSDARPFDLRELSYISAVGPRGIVPASVATLFSVQLAAEGIPNASVVAGLVFLVIVTTVVIEGPLGVYLPEFLFPEQHGVAIVGGGRMGTELADRLDDNGDRYRIVEHDRDRYERLRRDYRITHGDGTDKQTLESVIDEHDLERVVAGTDSDDINLFTSLLARNGLDVDVHARVNQPENEDRWEELGIEAVSPAIATVDRFEDLIPEYVVRVPLRRDELVGTAAVDVDLPMGVTLNRVRRGSRWFSGEADVQLESGDELTLFGTSEDALTEMRAKLLASDASPTENATVNHCSRAVLVGGGRVGGTLAGRLADAFDRVTVVEEDERLIEELSPDGYEVIEGSGADVEVLEAAGIEDADVLVVVTGDDQTNLLTAEIAIERFNTPAVLARCNNPEYGGSFRDLGIGVVSPPVAAASQVFDELRSEDEESSGASDDERGAVDDGEAASDIEQLTLFVSEDTGAGTEIRDVVPEEVAVVRIQRGSEEIVHPDDRTELKAGDELTVYGPDFIVTELREKL